MTASLDSAYKQLFSHPEIVRDLLSGFVPIPSLHQLDLTAFHRVNASYVSDGGPQRHGDMVWRLQIGADVVYIYLLLEFQSRPDPWMALRMQVYVGLLYEDLVRQHQVTSAGKLPPVLPIVLYNGPARWGASLDMAGLVLPAPDALRPFQPELRYLLIDQTQAAGGAGSENVVDLLFRLQGLPTAPMVGAVLAGVTEWLSLPGHHHLALSVKAWIRAHLQRQMKSASMDWTDTLTEVDIMSEMIFETWADRWQYDGMQKGLKQGLEQGLEQGALAALASQRRRLKRHLERRFGTLPAPVAAQVDDADLAHIDVWFDRSYDVPRLEDVFGAECAPPPRGAPGFI